MQTAAQTKWWNEADPVARERGRQMWLYRSALTGAHRALTHDAKLTHLKLARLARRAVMIASGTASASVADFDCQIVSATGSPRRVLGAA